MRKRWRPPLLVSAWRKVRGLPTDAEILAKQEKRELHERVEYLLREVSQLRSLVRYLLPDAAEYQRFLDETYASFDYQWRNLNEGLNLPSDESFRSAAVAQVEQYTGFPREWFRGKEVFDAGCGGGRWSWALSTLGARVTAVDQSESCLTEARQLCRDFEHFRAFHHSLLEPLPMREAFDLVWCYGVVHHTGNTWRALQNIGSLTRPGGYLLLMIYGEPRLDQTKDFEVLNSYLRLRQHLAPLDFDQRVAHLRSYLPADQIHGWFDAVSPRINDLFSREEIIDWLHRLGYDEIRFTVEARNHHLIARRIARPPDVAEPLRPDGAM
ncbi:MAG: class I SAM-dependent methyltransferase [Planctomycetia bacterium]|nr:class I SAM-dependent methyltransferase [Planctomycetia bacterium]